MQEGSFRQLYECHGPGEIQTLAITAPGLVVQMTLSNGLAKKKLMTGVNEIDDQKLLIIEARPCA